MKIGKVKQDLEYGYQAVFSLTLQKGLLMHACNNWVINPVYTKSTIITGAEKAPYKSGGFSLSKDTRAKFCWGHAPFWKALPI